MISIRNNLFGKCKFVQIPLGNKERVKTILVEKMATIQTDDNFCYVVYHTLEDPVLDSYKKMGIAFNYFPDSLSRAVVTVRFTNEGRLIEDVISMYHFIVNPFELTEDINKAMTKASYAIKFADRGWENQVENGNLYSVSKLMED